MDLDIAPLITEIRIHADKNGRFNIPSEYRSDVIYGPHVKALAVALYSEGVMSNDRIAVFLNAARNGELGLSNGSVYHFCKNFSEKEKNSLFHLQEELLNQTMGNAMSTSAAIYRRTRRR